MITPTVGRIVYYKASTLELQSPAIARCSVQPFRADVCHVNEDGTLVLRVIDHNGHSFAVGNVLLVQPEMPTPEEGPYAYWMPYQVLATPAV